MMGSCSKVELVWQALLWKAAAPSPNDYYQIAVSWLAVGTVLAVACLPLAAFDGFLGFGRSGKAA